MAIGRLSNLLATPGLKLGTHRLTKPRMIDLHLSSRLARSDSIRKLMHYNRG